MTHLEHAAPTELRLSFGGETINIALLEELYLCGGIAT
jgi:hypothetical protein